jgi:hypothetical protein
MRQDLTLKSPEYEAGFFHVYTVHHFQFHFIVPTGALNIKRNLTLWSLFQHSVLKTLQIFI